MLELNLTFDFLKITLASSKCLKKWGTRVRQNGSIVGQITSSEIINFKFSRPALDGLFCEKIFGPITSWECFCGAYKRLLFKNKRNICQICNVEVTSSSLRRSHMGYILLATPLVHIWYFNGLPSFLSLILNLSVKILTKIIYFSDNSILLKKFQHKTSFFNLLMGATSLKYLLTRVNLKNELLRCRLLLHFNKMRFSFFFNSFSCKERLIQRIRLLENLRSTKSHPKWLILETIPVLPPFLRPLLIDENGGAIISPLNQLYLNIITQNKRLLTLYKSSFSNFLLNNERRILQESVDVLIDNGKRLTQVHKVHKTSLQSLSSFLKGKFGYFRQNLLGKRVNFSGRSVIIVNPTMELYQCGLPYKMALEFFKPFLIRQFFRFIPHNSLVELMKMLNKEDDFSFFILTKLCKNRLILLNRAPTLHKLGIQAFEPRIIRENAIMLHPLICSAFNADFDGDQMAVHFPLTRNSQFEAKSLLFVANNILSVTTGEPVIVPSQDMIIGYSYLSSNFSSLNCHTNFYFNNFSDICYAFSIQKITIHTPIKVCSSLLFSFPASSFISQLKNLTFKVKTFIHTTFGRLLLNKVFYSTLYK